MASPLTPRPAIKLAPTVIPAVTTEETVTKPEQARVREPDPLPLVTGNYRLQPTVDVQPVMPTIITR